MADRTGVAAPPLTIPVRRVSFQVGEGAKVLAASLAILLAVLALYSKVLFPKDPVVMFPWSSDTWGHLIKVEFLYGEIKRGQPFPSIFPAWYNGFQFLRYYAPLPYYILVAMRFVVEDIVVIGNWYIFLCALVGALSFLAYRKKLGLVPATVGGILFTVLPDNVRVAFAEGNMPRILAVSLLPLAFYCLLEILSPGGGRRHLVGLAVLMALVVLSHAMMAAIFTVCLGIFVLVHWQVGQTGYPRARTAIVGLAGGMLLSAWWLLPSLTGGITELNQEAASEAVARFSPMVSLNPLLRTRDKEIYYMGLALTLAVFLSLFLWRRMTPLSKSLALTALFTELISSTTIYDLYAALPFHQLFWPLRFMSFTGFMLLLAAMSMGNEFLEKFRRGRLMYTGLVAVVGLDSFLSLPLIAPRQLPHEVVTISQEMKKLTGWRVATADLSRLGSGPSYFFTQLAGREQVYGWGYQGASTTSIVSAVNFALGEGYVNFAAGKLNLLGADDLVLLRGTNISADLEKGLSQVGYKLVQRGPRLDLYHKDGRPRAYRISGAILGIGSGAWNTALLFPRIVSSGSPYIDDYSLEYLASFPTLLLSGFQWHDRVQAEELVRRYVAAGGQVVVDLTGSPEHVFARAPKFLDIYGEAVRVLYQATLRRDGEEMTLIPFAAKYLPWKSVSPQGLDEITVSFDYYGATGTAVGYKEMEGGRVWFLGLNLAFHAALTQDPVATKLLEEVLGVPAHSLPEMEEVPLEDYQAHSEGFSFSFYLRERGVFLIPIASPPGTVVEMEGQPFHPYSLDNVISLISPSGWYHVRVYIRPTRVHTIGKVAAAFGLLLLLAYVGFAKLAPEPGERPAWQLTDEEVEKMFGLTLPKREKK